MFNRGKTSPVVETVPIDEDEQSKIADGLKQQAAAQAITTRSVFYYIFLVVAFILFICLLYSIFSPWEMEHQKVFENYIPSYGFFSFYSGSIFCYLVCAMLVQNTQKVNVVVMNLAYFIAALSMIMWGVVFNTYGVTNPLLYWLPLGNIAGIALAQYVDKDTRDLVTSVEGLEQYKYSFKGV